MTLLFLVAGCSTAPPADMPVAPALEPPPLRGDPALSREEALALIEQAPGPEDAIRALDDRRLAFALDAATLAWFEKKDVAEEVLDYLRKRAAVPWERLRGDVDPLTPETTEYVDPRRADEDFAGADVRGLFSSVRSLNPFLSEKRPAADPALGSGH